MTHSRAERPPTLPSKLFSGIHEDAIAEIVAAAHMRKVAAKRMMFAEGDKATHLFLQRTGRCRYFRLMKTGEEVLLHLLAPGDIFGIGAILKHPYPYIGCAEAVSDAEVLVWDHASIRKFATHYPQLADNALRIVLQYLTRYVNRHVGLVTQTAKQRLADTLVILGHRTGQILPTGVQVDVTNGQLGALADISSFTTSRLLSAWERGAVSKFRGRVLIHSPEALVVD
jgi:CRP-like cAMP-binding protein